LLREPRSPYDTQADMSGWTRQRHYLPVRLHLRVRATGEGTLLELQEARACDAGSWGLKAAADLPHLTGWRYGLMELLYNSEAFSVVQISVAGRGDEVMPLRGGFEIVDKSTRKGIYIEGALWPMAFSAECRPSWLKVPTSRRWTTSSPATRRWPNNRC
jgi:hypothetical protein